MKVFISWSGQQSKEIAAVFKEWIPAVIQAARPYFSSSDIDKGARWANEIATELEASKFGLICLTKENLEAPWLMFEAGALSKSLDNSRVCPMLFGITAADLAGPLVQFQAAPFSKEEVFKVIKSINSQLVEYSLETSVLDSVFTKWWPELESKINTIIAKKPTVKDKDKRTERDLLEEILKITRLLQFEERSDRSTKNNPIPSDIVEMVLAETYELAQISIPREYDTNYLERLDRNIGRISRMLSLYLPAEMRRIHNSRFEELSQTINARVKEIIDIPF